MSLLLQILLLSPIALCFVVEDHTTYISVEPLEVTLSSDKGFDEEMRQDESTYISVEPLEATLSSEVDVDKEKGEDESTFKGNEDAAVEKQPDDSKTTNTTEKSVLFTTISDRQDSKEMDSSTTTPSLDTTTTNSDLTTVMSNSDTTTTTPPLDTMTTETEPLTNGRIPWAPYKLPNCTTDKVVIRDIEGRWISKDVQMLNIIPGFTYPMVSLNEGQAIPIKANISSNFEQTKSRVKRAQSATKNPYVAKCGGTFRDLYGVIQSPEFPLYYPNRKQCMYDIEVPENHTIKITCERFSMQGGSNCSHDYMMVDFSGDTAFSNGQKFCGLTGPAIVTNGTRMTIQFKSDDLFRYQGFSCRYRALQPNGIAVMGSFGNATDNTKPKVNGNNFLQVVQCPQIGDEAAVDNDDGTGAYAGAAIHSGMWNGQCGNQNLPPLNRVVGGYATDEFEYPWMAAVLKKCGDTYCHICGATIISEEWILTGAHCMVNVDKEDLGVLVGDHNLYTVSNSQKFIKIKEKVIHPDYGLRGNESSPLNNDIGLLRLEYPIIFTSQISPLCLPALGETGFGGSAFGTTNTSSLDTTGLDIVGKNATVLGWGLVSDSGEFAEALRGVEVRILDNNDCHVLYGIMTETMMCTSGDNGRGTCFGDSGGPAIVKQPDGSYVQVGILSFGALAGCEKGYPSGQVLVHKYIDWIQSITGIAFGG